MNINWVNNIELHFCLNIASYRLVNSWVQCPVNDLGLSGGHVTRPLCTPCLVSVYMRGRASLYVHAWESVVFINLWNASLDMILTGSSTKWGHYTGLAVHCDTVSLPIDAGWSLFISARTRYSGLEKP
jgi:hypothetical protein